MDRSLVTNGRGLEKIENPQWLAGFTSGEGCFLCTISKSNTKTGGVSVQLRFVISQHSRNEQLMKNFIKYFGCGNLYKKD